MPCVRPKAFVHVVYRTRRFEAMLQWYAIVSDARVQHRNPAIAFLTDGDEHHRLAIVSMDALRPGESEGDRRGIDRLRVSRESRSKDDPCVATWRR